MRRRGFSLGLGVLLACASACDPGGQGADDTDSPIDTDTNARPEVQVDKEVDETYTIDPDRFILRLDRPGACTEPLDGWSVARLFDDPDEPLDPRSDQYTDLLSFYCVYDRISPNGARDPLPGMTGPSSRPIEVPGGVGNNEHLGLTALAADMDLLHTYLYSRFIYGSGVARLDPLPSSGPPQANAEQTTVMLLDSSPDSSGFWPQDTTPFQGPPGHGLWLSALLQLMTCPDKILCPVNLQTVQVLGRSKTAHYADPPEGSQWGTLGDLARGVRRAMRMWDARGGRARVGPVVINLSVGWHPYYGGGMPGAWEIGSEGETVPSAGDPVFSWDKVDPSTFPPDVRAVFDALAYARCKGALAFAAAGNATAGPFGGSGPLLPAAWEGLDTAKIPSCEALGIPGIVAPTVVDPAVPLVVAVGGVDAADEPLSVGRPNSRPLLVADGDHARFDVQYSIVQTEGPSLTGTSVSAIVASSAAAALWSMDTKLTPSQVLQRLLDSGTPVGAADPWSLHAVESRYDAASLRPDDARDVQSRRLRVCDQLVGPQSGWICKETTLTSIGDFGQATQVDQIAGTWPGAAETDPACGDRQLFRAATASDPPASDPCPELQYFGPVIAPWVLPQPDQAGCSDCFLDVVGGKLFIQLNELWTAESLVMTVKAGSGTYEFALPASSIPDNQDSLAVSFNPASAPVGVTQASLTVVRLNRSVIFPVLVIGP